MDALLDALGDRKLAVLTGAGISTESGIPDYRGPGTARRARNPIQYRAFVRDGAARQRYWARSMVGWPRIAGSRPNAGHRAVADLEASGKAVGVITQNVDGLHQAAGSRAVIELHGTLAEVRCLSCDAVEPRHELQDRLRRLNPGWDHAGAGAAPDGDADLESADGFRVPDCRRCRGTLKPNVVFFGENVPRPVVDRAFAVVDGADALLVVGSSLTVYSGFRFVRRAAERGMAIGIVNIGPTRGDELATVRIDGRAGDVLRRFADAVG